MGCSAAELFICAATLVPPRDYLIAAAAFLLIFLYNFLEFHVVGDFLRGLRGDSVNLTFDSTSQIYQGVVSKCRTLHGRYLATPWLASPHFQTAFLNFFGRPPAVTYRRQLYTVQDGGTIALDWLLASDVAGGSVDTIKGISKDDTTPIAVVIPGLTSDSASSYLKHLAYELAKGGRNVVVSNHRGLGGVNITSDCFYNAGWTEDLREVVNYLKREHPNATLVAVGTSIGANILVKYLGEDGDNTPLAGAAAVCSPWDLVICDRFINRKLVQRLYDRALAVGLQGYAQLHQSVLDKLANWDGIRKSRSVRDFDNHATCRLAKYETVDTYYRRCSSVSYVGNIAVPLLCISALDDPVCTKEAIPWDECRANKNIVLATIAHGGHLAFFQGITAHSLWWVGAVDEFLGVLLSSDFMHQQKKDPNPHLPSSLESTVDKSPCVNVMEDGMIATVGNDEADNTDQHNSSTIEHFSNEMEPENRGNDLAISQSKQIAGGNSSEPAASSSQRAEDVEATRRTMNQLSRQSRRSMWLLAYVAFITTCPLVGSVLLIIFRRKLKDSLPAWLKR